MLSQKAKETDESLVEYLDRLSAGFRQIKERGPGVLPSVRLQPPRPQHKAASWQLDVPAGTADHVRSHQGSESGENIMSASCGNRKRRSPHRGMADENEKTNQVSIRKRGDSRKSADPDCIQTAGIWKWIYTLLEVHLITGRSHPDPRPRLPSDIRSPGIKYGDPRVNEEVKKRFGVRSQMLHAWRLVMPETISEPLSYLAGKEFTRAYAGGDETDGRDDEISSKTPSQSSPVNFKLCENQK